MFVLSVICFVGCRLSQCKDGSGEARDQAGGSSRIAPQSGVDISQIPVSCTSSW